MCSLDGIVYANTVDGTSNSVSELTLLDEAADVYQPNGYSAIT